MQGEISFFGKSFSKAIPRKMIHRRAGKYLSWNAMKGITGWF
jgi:hypothetical protein